MKIRSKLLLDIGLSPRVAAALREAGHEVDHVVERGPDTLSDEHMLVLAHAEHRIVVTFDLDFPRLLALNRVTQASVILFRVESATTDDLIAWLLDLLPRSAAELEAGGILVIDSQRERFRALPTW